MALRNVKEFLTSVELSENGAPLWSLWEGARRGMGKGANRLGLVKRKLFLLV